MGLGPEFDSWSTAVRNSSRATSEPPVLDQKVEPHGRSCKFMEGHGKSWNLMEGSVSVTKYDLEVCRNF